MDNQRFIEAIKKTESDLNKSGGIGTLGEKTLHAVLKNYFEPNINNQEIKVGSKYADIVNDNGIIEVQTKQFNKLRKKLETFLPKYKVTLVYPIAFMKFIYWVDEDTGEITKGRKSPKNGQANDAFLELYKIKNFLKDENLKICIVLLHIDEYRSLNGWSKDRKKGSHCKDRIPFKIEKEIMINSICDYSSLIPKNIPEVFSSKDYSLGAKIKRSTAQTALNILNYLDIVERVGKKGNSILYKIK
ncbi:MAG: hypothetical protein GX275_06525 [Clostridiales bacterium]|nr:hypothetical protein [Clostridiales bacterium]